MIALLAWLAGSVGIVYEMTVRHYWHVLVGNVLALGFVVWVFGGASILARRLPAPGKGRMTRADADAAIAAARARERAARAESERRP